MYKYIFILKKFIKIQYNSSLLASFITNFTILCTSICVLLFVLTISINNTFKYKVENSIIAADGYYTIDSKNKYFLDNDDYIHIKSILPTNFIASRLYSEKSILRTKNKSEGVLIKYVDFDALAVFGLDKSLDVKDIDDNLAIIGITLAEKLNININDEVNVINYADNDYSVSTFKIGALLNTSIPDFDTYFMYVDIENCNSIICNGNNFQSIIVNLNSKNNEKHNISNILSDYNITTYLDKYSDFFIWLKSYDFPIKILLLFILLICIFNLISSIIIDLNNQTKEIKLFKLMGLNNFQLTLLYSMKYTIISFLGGLIGIIVSNIFSNIQNDYNIIKIPESVYFMSNFSIILEYSGFIIFMLILLLVSFSCNYIFLKNYTLDKA